MGFTGQAVVSTPVTMLSTVTIILVRVVIVMSTVAIVSLLVATMKIWIDVEIGHLVLIIFLVVCQSHLGVVNVMMLYTVKCPVLHLMEQLIKFVLNLSH